METTNKVFLRGFSIDVVYSSRNLCMKYKSLIKKIETNLEIYDKMSGVKGRAKSCDDVINSFNASFKGFDNDSGYISQAVESNSSVETTGDNRFIEAMASLSAGSIYVNEDALLEKPHISPKHTGQVEDKDEDYQEFDHLFFMSSIAAPMLDSSVTSQNTNFSGFEGDESEVSETSGIIPVATPLIVPSNVLVNKDKSCLKQNDEDSDNLKENDSNYLNVKSKPVDSACEDDCTDNKSLTSIENGKSAINEQTSGIMDTNVNDTSFESFYSHLCGLYTRSDFPAEDLGKISINPNSLHNFNDFGKEKDQENAVFSSPYKNSYVELETVPNKESSVEFSGTTSCSFQNSDYVKQGTGFTDTTCKGSYIELEGINKKTTIITCDDSDLTTSVIHNSKRKESHDLLNGKQSFKVQDSNWQKASLTPLKQYKNPVNPDISPELFSDEESLEQFSHNESFALIQKACEQKYTTKNDRKLLQRAQESLCGVLPPPSVTIIQMSVNEMLQRINANRHFFAVNSICDLVDNCDTVNKTEVQTQSVNSSNLKSNNTYEIKESLLVTCKREDFNPEDWPDIIQFRYHGLHYNRSKISEDFEHLCLKYAERYIGAETQSSCTVFGTDILSPSKRRCKFKRVAKSPGKRLSHLAKRRISFTNIASQCGAAASSCSLIGARTRQIMVDARKFELLSRRKSPRKKSPRKTPGKSPRKKVNTPSSSSKKRFSLRLKSNEEDSLSSVASTSSSRASVTKRALFQSPPDKGETTNGLLQLFGSNMSNESSQSAKRRTPRRALFNSPLKSSPSKMSISSLYPAKRKMTPKRALFMSPEKSPSKRIENCDRKRKRIDSESEQPNKISRIISSELKSSSNESSRTVTRSQSSTTSSFQTQDIVAHRKKKMLWAVAEALRSQNIDMKHPQFKVFASVLARLIRHFLPNLFTNGPRPEGSSTESMLRIARQHVFAVTRGKTVEQIIKEAESKVRVAKPSGYVGLEKVESMRNKENVLQDRVNIIGSGRLQSDASHLNKNSRPANVERIRKVIDFGEEDNVKNQSSR
ncbi:hypothetical protein ILUMI_04765 [Ignelater luminosus]|uniref:Uncharacterized protein n=1 Tax=Ignelater luminosus TaxID=2038154 RepID=A0A8K0D8J2_IGNLU|nr:hypothetical protein ILUMI_04765 [Ignelater luminosus]